MNKDQTYNDLLGGIYEIGTAVERGIDVRELNLLKLSLWGRIRLALKDTIAEGSEDILCEKYVPLSDKFDVVTATYLATIIRDDQWKDHKVQFLERAMAV